MSKIALKKFLNDNLEFKLQNYIEDYIIHDFAYNTQDRNLVSGTAKAKQFINIKQDLLELKAKTIISVLGVASSKDFAERILRNLPDFERTDKLIRELAVTISEELKKIELLKREYTSGLTVTTSSAISLKKLEDIYGVNADYESGVKLRQNTLIAREITRFSTFNFAYILKMADLFMVGKVIDIINDKGEKTISIILEERLKNISTLENFRKHMLEFSPAFYEIKIINEVMK